MKKKGQLADDTLYKLGFKSYDDPVDKLIRCEGNDLPSILASNQLGNAFKQSAINKKKNSQLLNGKYTSLQTKRKLLN